jgi:hypothetical protein
MDTKLLLKEVRKEIARLEKIARLLGASKGTGKPTGKKKRVVSAEARAAIGAAQKKRWAKVRAEKKEKAKE